MKDIIIIQDGENYHLFLGDTGVWLNATEMKRLQVAVSQFKAEQKSYYDAKIKGKNKEYYQRYYREHKDKMREYARKWREANKEKSKAYMRKYNKKTYWLRKAKEQAKKESNKIQNLSTDKIATIFKNPAAAQHYKWLMQKRGVIKTESEVEHEVTA